MVHIKRIELSNFKSFGGTTAIPFLPGFTVVSGPNGSGKSNILDALLFCLGLASSKGMRAERLPDLVNHTHSTSRNTAEANVSVTFDISDLGQEGTNTTIEAEIAANGNGYQNSGEQDAKQVVISREWTVSRRLRVTKGGNYSSTYYINGEVATATELHEELNRLRIYPEGYNVVLQGDVTRIITMNSKERREIIDELAGVAEFDRKIEKTKETLEEVREREERYRIIETELARSLERLAADRLQAEKYQKLRAQVQEKQQWEIVLKWQAVQQQFTRTTAQFQQGEQENAQLTASLTQLSQQIDETRQQFDQLNAQVKALGEEEQLSVAAQLATQQAQRQQLEQRYQELEKSAKQHQASLTQTHQQLSQYQQQFLQLTQEKSHFESHTLPQLQQERDGVKAQIEQLREQSQAIASASEAWVQEQTALSRKITNLQENLTPQRTEQAQLRERQEQLTKIIAETSPKLTSTETELTQKETEAAQLSGLVGGMEQHIQAIAQQLSDSETDRSLLQETQNRLLAEQREKQRQLDKLEATKQAQSEVQGTYATQMILQSDLPGVCGLVAQLGQVDPRYQLALEISAGARLGYVVVEDDGIAAAGIELLKHAKAGRATFLPLTKIRPPRLGNVNLSYARGYIDLAVNLVDCDDRYQDIFLFIFGNTVVFENLDTARPHLGKYRIVTLEGDILESSGAMTGGSKPSRPSIRFGATKAEDSAELRSLKQRLADIERIQARNDEGLAMKAAQIKQLSHDLTEARQRAREDQLRLQQLEKDIQRLSQQRGELTCQLTQSRQDLATIQDRLGFLNTEVPRLETELQQEQQKLTDLESSQTHKEWQDIQAVIKSQEVQLQLKEKALRDGENHLKDLQNQTHRFEEKIAEAQSRIEAHQSQAQEVTTQQETLTLELQTINTKITEIETLLAQLSQRLGQTKQERDRLEATLRSQQQQHQQITWQQEKLTQTQQERQATLNHLQEQIAAQQPDLPDPLPKVPLLAEFDAETGDYTTLLENLQREIRNGQKRLEAMEPVNMLALEEHEKTQARLSELSEKLATIEAERTELLLRVENFTTLRLRSFKDAFDAVNDNFQTIFAELSDGDGYLQLDNSEDPFSGGLNLVAHPKGKPVQRLSSMSGGEKSLTALSFIFALQRYRPSPFYGFDEVDMFLDGANVEKLSRMVKKQAQQAQFIVVSLRRPMIEASERTIGVTQARGAHTQVLGIKL